MNLKVFFLMSLCIFATSIVCNIALTLTNTPSAHSQYTLASMNYGIDDDPEPTGDPDDPPDIWP